jgi:biotin carboxylase
VFSKKIKPDGVFCHAAELAVPVAHVAEALNLPGNGLHAAVNTTDKTKRIKIFHDGKIPSPEYRFINKNDSFGLWKDFFNQLHKKVVCKPPHFAGARGVQYIDNILSLENYSYNFLQNYILNHYL